MSWLFDSLQKRYNNIADTTTTIALPSDGDIIVATNKSNTDDTAETIPTPLADTPDKGNTNASNAMPTLNKSKVANSIHIVEINTHIIFTYDT